MRKGLHVVIIMDGNGRWAPRRGLRRLAGHRARVAAVRRVVERAPALGIRWLTLYAFSSDNWRRPADAVENIFWLMGAYLCLETERLRQHGAQLEIIGRRDRLPYLLLREIGPAENATAEGSRLHLRFAIDYSSRDTVTRAVARATNALSPDQPSSADVLGRMLAQALTAESGEVNLLIRAGGGNCLSDFLLWEPAYAELLFTDRMWPDFDATDLHAPVAEFNRREQRLGGVSVATADSVESAQ